ncbi:MAG TPA: DNA methyltransferase [Jatrophihabitans sp.]|nr:DNA methyltransferase [Jatrophihabitans sp.]
MKRVLQVTAAELAAERLADADEDVHFPSALVRAVLEEYTEPGGRVLDPFAGFGTTLAVSAELGRTAVGIELLPERVALIRQRVGTRATVIEADARQLAELDLGVFDLCMTSPPYMAAEEHPWNPLTAYMTLDADYRSYLADLGTIFAAVADRLRPGGHIAFNAADLRYQGNVTRLARDIADVIEAIPGMVLEGEIRLDWDEPPEWLAGDYCLVFRRNST